MKAFPQSIVQNKNIDIQYYIYVVEVKMLETWKRNATDSDF